jgi:hypothetical protein
MLFGRMNTYVGCYKYVCRMLYEYLLEIFSIPVCLCLLSTVSCLLSAVSLFFFFFNFLRTLYGFLITPPHLFLSIALCDLLTSTYPFLLMHGAWTSHEQGRDSCVRKVLGISFEYL